MIVGYAFGDNNQNCDLQPIDVLLIFEIAIDGYQNLSVLTPQARARRFSIL